MRALLVLNRNNGNARIMVQIKKKIIQDQVMLLLEENKVREAFDLLKHKAEFESYLPVGTKLPVNPEVTLIEDLI